MQGFYSSDSEESSHGWWVRVCTVCVFGSDTEHVCGEFSGCSWTGCIIDVLLALPGSCSLIRVCQGISSLRKANQENREKARSASHHHPPLPHRNQPSFKGKKGLSTYETSGWVWHGRIIDQPTSLLVGNLNFCSSHSLRPCTQSYPHAQQPVIYSQSIGEGHVPTLLPVIRHYGFIKPGRSTAGWMSPIPFQTQQSHREAHIHLHFVHLFPT